MINKTLLLFLVVAIVPTLAVVNGNANNKKEAQRREASLSDAYGPPQALQLPAPIYGQPAFATYPAPPPDVPPPAPVPHKEYGVPVAKYGPPTTVNIEYGPPQARPLPPQKPSFLGQSLPSFNQVSFFDQIKSMFTGSGSGGKHQAYGPPPRKSFPKPNYGPPQQHRPAGNYGPPPSQPQLNYGPPAQNYGPPPVQHIVHRPPQPPPQVIHHHVSKPVQNYGPPPSQNHGPPVHQKPLGPQFASSGSGTPFRVNCDGWKPIPGPAIPYDSSGPSSSYGPPASGSVSGGGASFGHSASGGGASFGHSSSGGGASYAQSSSGGGASFGHSSNGGGASYAQSSSGGGASFGHSANGGGASFGHSANGGGASFGHSGSGGGASFGHSASGGADSSSFVQSSGTSYSQSGGSSYAEQQSIDQDIGSLLTVPINEAQAFHGGSDNSQGHGQELINSIVGGDSYSAPPIETYAPGTYAPSFLLKQGHSSNHGASQVSSGHSSSNSFDHHSIGLIPPGERYGAPGRGGAHIDAGLAIKHGSISGNLKPWPVKGAPPRQPLSFREPVPQGLIESIGHSVTHLDNFGVKPQQHGGVYLPPPAAELPVPSNDLNVLPVNHAPQQFLTQHNFQQSNHGAVEQQGFLEQTQQLSPPKYNAPKFQTQQQFYQQSGGNQFSSHHQQQQQFNSYPAALPLVQEPRYTGYSGMSDCGRGPQTFGGHQQGQSQQQTFVSDSYGLPAQGPAQGFDSYGPPPPPAQYQQQTLHSNVVTSYQVAPSNGNAGSELETPQSSYGPPASGNPIDNQGYESQVKSATTTIEGESKDTQESASSQTLNLPGLSSVAGLDLLSAQKSQSLEIPVQGSLGSYQLQFQAADPIGSAGNGNDIEHPPHQQILSEGLLQSILSAIEQPNQGNAIPQTTYDQQTDHSDAAVFLESPEGQKVLSESVKSRR